MKPETAARRAAEREAAVAEFDVIIDEQVRSLLLAEAWTPWLIAWSPGEGEKLQ
jgi:hypothetical protein